MSVRSPSNQLSEAQWAQIEYLLPSNGNRGSSGRSEP
jgi:hypothetical protein